MSVFKEVEKKKGMNMGFWADIFVIPNMSLNKLLYNNVYRWCHKKI